MKKNLYFLLKMLISILLVVYILNAVDNNLLSFLNKIKHPQYLFLSLLFPVFINPIITGNRLKFFLSTLGVKENLLTLVKINFKSIFLGIILPSSIGYDAIRIYEIEKKHSDKKGVAAAAIIIERLIGFLLLGLISIIGSVYVVLILNINIPEIILGIFFFLSILFLFVFYIRKGYFLNILSTSNYNVISKIKNYFIQVVYSIKGFPIREKFITTFFLIFSLQLAGIIMCYLIFLSFDVNISFANHLFLIPIIQILTVIPISISGIGVREGAFIYFYGLLGVENELCLYISILYYFIGMIVPSLIGFIFYLSSIVSEKIQFIYE